MDPRSRNRQDLERNYIRSKALHHLRMTTIKTQKLQDTLDSFGLNYSAANKVKVLWAALWDWCVVNDVVDRNYAKYVKVSSEVKSELHKPYSDAEIHLMWDNLDKYPNLDYVLITCYTGMRPGELLALQKSNINLEERTMRGGSKTTAGKNRLIPIHKRIVPLLEARIDKATGEHLFYTDRGKAMQYGSLLTMYWPEMMNPLGLEHKPHDGRHTCTTNLDRKGANDTAIKMIIGHKSADFTKRVYTHKHIEDLLAAIDLLD
ncbi:MAG: site-specific integrase [Youngiibacter sp.]|nr:site-specific integrase [Youngiibacter sp.]